MTDARGMGATPYWARLGFASLEEFIAGLEENQRRLSAFGEARSRPPVPEPNLPEVRDLGPPVPPDPMRDRQVGIRIAAEDYSRLAAAAEIYGVRPSTLARMLVKRGAEAILERENGAESG